MSSTSVDRRLGLSAGTAYKTAATVVATSNITQSGEQTIDTVAVKALNAAGVPDRVLCVGQTDGTKNGLWDVSTGSWTRSLDANNNIDFVQGTQILITQGSNAYRTWAVTTASPIVFGTTSIAFSQSLSTTFWATLWATLIASTGASLIGWIQRLTSSVYRTVQDKLYDNVNVLDFMTAAQIADVRARTSTQDVTAAFNAAVASLGTMSRLRIPSGKYKITGEWLISANRVQVIGDGSYSTEINFAPAASGTCLKIQATTATVISQGSVRGIAFTSADSTYLKTAIEAIDIDIYKFDDVTVAGSVAGTGAASGSYFWSGGGGSVGIRIRGRDQTTFKGICVFADRPIVISVNPNNSISLDHFHFQDLYLGANNNPHVEVDTGVNITQCRFDGYQAWVLGTSGFKWVDTTTSGVSNGLHFENVRTEQPMDATAYSFNIQHNTGLQSPSFRNCYPDTGRKGVYLRKCENVLFDHHFHGGTKEPLNVSATVKRMNFVQCFWQAGSDPAVMTGQRMIFGSPFNPATAPLPGTAVYDESANTVRNITLDGAVSQPMFAVGASASVALGSNGLNPSGMISIVDDRELSALFMAQGNQGVSTEVSDPGSCYATTRTTGMTSIYWSSANTRYELQNDTTATRSYRLALLGTYGSFSTST